MKGLCVGLVVFFSLSLFAMDNKQTWKKADDGDDFIYTCLNGDIQGSKIRIRIQDNFDDNRYCEIILNNFTTLLPHEQWNELARPIKKACNEIKTCLYSPGIGIARCAFWFRAGNDKAIEFLTFVERLNKICHFDDQTWTEITAMLKDSQSNDSD